MAPNLFLQLLNVISCSVGQDTHLMKISAKLVKYFLCDLAYKHTPISSVRGMDLLLPAVRYLKPVLFIVCAIHLTLWQQTASS